MADKFLDYWFHGFERAINDIDDESRRRIFEECGRSCSDSYTKQIYIDEYKVSQSMDEFLGRIKNRFPEVGFRVIKGNEIVELTYNFCACDLVRKGYIKKPLLCECSRQSLLYNWGSVFGKDRVKVQLLQSILGGNPCCKFLIYLSQSTSFQI